MDFVTGAFSCSGSAIAAELISRGRQVCTLTNHPPDGTDRAGPNSSAIMVRPLVFSDSVGLRESLSGADTLYNTYWVRFPYRTVTFESAIAASAELFAAAADAGVRRVVHISITHANPASPFDYFRGKGCVEEHLRASGLSHAIVRPAILFGGDGVLINNIAWLMRRSPLTLYGGDGQYRIRGIHISDLARLMVDLGEDEGNLTVDAVGPQSLTFTTLLNCIREAIQARTLIAPIPSAAFPFVTWTLGQFLRDTLLTRPEYHAMAAGLADSNAPSTGTIALTDWIGRHGDDLGVRYAHELHRHYRLPRSGLQREHDGLRR